jgi:hypothetical protein
MGREVLLQVAKEAGKRRPDRPILIVIVDRLVDYYMSQQGVDRILEYT